MPNWKLVETAVVEDGDAEVVEPFNPGSHNIDEVKKYVTDNPDEAQAVYDAEVDGKARSSLLEWLTADG